MRNPNFASSVKLVLLLIFGSSLVEQPSRKDLINFFPFGRDAIAIFLGRLDPLHLYPTWVLEIVVAHAWGISLMPWWLASSSEDAQIRPIPPTLPSMRISGSSTPLVSSAGIKRAYWGKDVSRPGNLDPTRGENEIILNWQYTTATYTSDFGVYIWEPQNSIPISQYSKIIMSLGRMNPEEFRLLVVFGSSRAHELFTDQRDSIRSSEATCRENDDNQHWSPRREVILSICCVFTVLIKDTWEFIRKCHDESGRIVSKERLSMIRGLANNIR